MNVNCWLSLRNLCQRRPTQYS